MRTLSRVPVLLALMASAPVWPACTSSGDAGDDTGKEDGADQNGFDVNDLSFLFGLNNGRPSPAIALDDAALKVSDVIFGDVAASLAADTEYPFGSAFEP